MSTTPQAPDAIGVGSAAMSPALVSFSEAFSFWLKLGFVSFGGSAGQIAIVHQELIEKQHWIAGAASRVGSHHVKNARRTSFYRTLTNAIPTPKGQDASRSRLGFRRR